MAAAGSNDSAHPAALPARPFVGRPGTAAGPGNAVSTGSPRPARPFVPGGNGRFGGVGGHDDGAMPGSGVQAPPASAGREPFAAPVDRDRPAPFASVGAGAPVAEPAFETAGGPTDDFTDLVGVGDTTASTIAAEPEEHAYDVLPAAATLGEDEWPGDAPGAADPLAVYATDPYAESALVDAAVVPGATPPTGSRTVGRSTTPSGVAALDGAEPEAGATTSAAEASSDADWLRLEDPPRPATPTMVGRATTERLTPPDVIPPAQAWPDDVWSEARAAAEQAAANDAARASSATSDAPGGAQPAGEMAGAATAYGESYAAAAHAPSDIDHDEIAEVARRLEAIVGDLRSGVLILPRDAGAGRDSEALVAVLGAILRAGR